MTFGTAIFLGQDYLGLSQDISPLGKPQYDISFLETRHFVKCACIMGYFYQCSFNWTVNTLRCSGADSMKYGIQVVLETTHFAL